MASRFIRYCIDLMAVMISCGDASEWLQPSRNGRSRSCRAYTGGVRHIIITIIVIQKGAHRHPCCKRSG